LFKESVRKERLPYTWKHNDIPVFPETNLRLAIKADSF